MLEPILTAENLVKSYDRGRVRALKGVSLTVTTDELLAVMGASGSGKTTLLQVLGAISRPDQGQVQFNGQDYAAVKDLAAFRLANLGFIFQFAHLFPMLTVEENVRLALIGRKWTSTEVRIRIKEVLTYVGIDHLSGQLAGTLSAGEQQRAAICRAIIHRPRLILADEPTGNLDQDNTLKIMELFRDIHRSQATPLIMVTHDPDVASWCDRTLIMKDGLIGQR